MISSFVYGDFLAKLNLEELVNSRFIEATVRGGFGHVFRRITCINKGEDCDKCQFNETCIFRFVFDTQPPENTIRMRKYNKIPRPFTLSVVPEGDRTFIVNVKLFGDSIKYLPYFVNSFMTLGKIGLGRERTEFELGEVVDVTSEKLLFKDGKHTKNRPIARKFNLNLHEGCNSEKVKINLISPLSIRKNGKELFRIDVVSFIMTMLRRIGNLCYFHQGIEIEIDYKALKKKAAGLELIEDNTYPVNRNRFSTRQKRSISMGGLLGNFVVMGDLSGIINYLKLGEIIHVGRGTTFGQGKFKMEVLNGVEQ